MTKFEFYKLCNYYKEARIYTSSIGKVAFITLLLGNLGVSFIVRRKEQIQQLAQIVAARKSKKSQASHMPVIFCYIHNSICTATTLFLLSNCCRFFDKLDIKILVLVFYIYYYYYYCALLLLPATTTTQSKLIYNYNYNTTILYFFQELRAIETNSSVYDIYIAIL